MLKEDTKIEVELSGEIDSNQESQEGSSSKSSLLGGMSLPVPVNLSQPAVKEWFGKRRANIRPLGQFFNTHNFQVTEHLDPRQVFLTTSQFSQLGQAFSWNWQLIINIAGPSFCREIDQAPVQECWVFPVQLCDGLHSVGPLLSHQLSPAAHSHSRHGRSLLYCWTKERWEETVYCW